MTPKIISYDVEIKSTSKLWVQKVPEVYTNDSNSVEIQFNLVDCTEAELLNSTAQVLLYMQDGSFFQNTGVDVVRTGTTFSYTLKDNEGNHQGLTETQLVLTIPGTPDDVYASQMYQFKIKNGLGNKVPVETFIQTWETLTAEANAFIAQMETDVQEFDVALESGVLATNIAAKLTELETTYAPDLFTVKQQLAETATKNELSQVASPLVASLVAQMTNTARVYVYTGAEGGYTAGNWYYHNGTAWISGGVYQASGIGDGSVTPTKTSFIRDSINLYKGGVNNLGISSTGTLTGVDASGGYASDLITITATAIHAKKITRIAYYDTNGTFITPPISDGLQTGVTRIIPPVGAISFRYSVAAADIGTAFIAQSDATTLVPEYSSKLQNSYIDEGALMAKYFRKSINLYDNLTVNNSGIGPTGLTTVDAGCYASAMYTITGDLYAYKVGSIAFYDSARVFISRTVWSGPMAKVVKPGNAIFFRYFVQSTEIQTAFICTSASPVTIPEYTDKLQVDKIDANFLSAIVIKKDPASTDDAPIINKAIAQGGRFLLVGQFVIGASIKVPSNTELNFAQGSSVSLKDGANCYMITNSDWVNGNENITIKGFALKGNGNNQVRNYTGGALVGYFGFGVFFYKVKNIKVTDGSFEYTNAWAVAHYHCDGFEFSRLKFNQRELNGMNGDGVTGCSSNGLIEDLSGYVSDDMVGLGAFSGSMQGYDINIPIIDVENVVINNIFPGKSPTGKPSHIAVGLYATNNRYLKNVTVDNVKGYTELYLVRVLNYWPATPVGIFKGIKIRNLERYNIPATGSLHVVYVSDGVYDTLTIEDIQNISDPSQSASLVYIEGDTTIDNLIIKEALMTNNHPSTIIAMIRLIGSTANIKNVFLNNCKINAPAGNLDYVFRKETNPNLTRVYANGLESGGTEIYTFVGSNVGVNAPGVSALASRLTGRVGDMVVDVTDNAPKYFNGTSWISLI